MNSLLKLIFVFCTIRIGLFSINGYRIYPEYIGFQFKKGEPHDGRNFGMKKFLRNGTSSTTTPKPETTPQAENEHDQFLADGILVYPIFYNDAEEFSYLESQNSGVLEAFSDVQSYSASNNDPYSPIRVNNAEYPSSHQLIWPEDFYSRTMYYPSQNTLHPFIKSPCGDGFYTDDKSFNPLLCKLIRTLMNITPSTTVGVNKRQHVTTKFIQSTTNSMDNLADLRLFSQSTTPTTTSFVITQNSDAVLRTEATNSSRNGSQFEGTTNAKVIGYFRDANDNLCVREIVEMSGKVSFRYTCTEKVFNENKMPSSSQIPDAQNIKKSTIPVIELNIPIGKTLIDPVASTENDLRAFVWTKNISPAEMSTENNSENKLVTKNISKTDQLTKISNFPGHQTSQNVSSIPVHVLSV